ncbi:DEAD/DEAH box helicase [Siphonobacter aquaeclarae]|uniref:ATP-dependent RNA helicase RhlE n=1 Tax=Siphonobacter aquaeclarae TaxID=563176 RepID=A0A1G9N7T2_9BACT|nr:DEAD/DEAH box helicase [Siphonobacter aquaeclarae]SDL82361.1 ATP-dependent RNA helicase RhlE [Siphonobacter aquaeclarae]
MTFEDFKLNRQLLNAVEEAGYQTPTEIQQQAIPLVLAGHDVLGIAQTGTGKTAAYALPLLYKIKFAQGKAPRCLVLAPTRELVMQIGEAMTSLGKYTDLRVLCLYGGLGPKPQIEALNAGVDILVSTPGRFMDLYLRGEIITKELKVMVLDEADKMMDMGFMPQIRAILEVIPTKRQNLLFSATFPAKVESLSHEFLEFPTRIEVTPQATAAETVAQLIYEVPNLKTKIHLLSHMLRDEALQKVMVFVRSKEVADNIYKFIARKVVPEDKVRVIHANKGQNTRINAMQAFRDNEIRVLVTTDVAARGIDIQEVTHVINFDVPLVYEDYVHRIGRTGRAFHTGEAITFVTMAEEYHIAKIEKLIGQEIPRDNLPDEVEIENTPFDERQDMLREVDSQRKKEDPTFKGAFHEKKHARPHSGRPGTSRSGGKPAGRSTGKPAGGPPKKGGRPSGPRRSGRR